MFKFFTKEVVKHFVVPEYIIFSVDNFNNWFNNPNNNAIYANPGIFLRTDKLSVSQVEDYCKKCYGFETIEIYKIYGGDKVAQFVDEIRLNWLSR